MEIKAYFKNRKDLVGWLVKQLSILPDNICLKYLGVNEGVINKRDVISEEKLLNEYIAENPQGFFAFSEGKANANIEFENEYSSISMYCDDESSGELALNVDKIFGSFIKYNAYYIYSALDLEFRNKNKAIVQQNTDTIEFWLGRDINRYLPGIYWRNWVSEEYQDFLKINIHEVIDQAGLEEYDLGNGVYFGAGRTPDEFSQYCKGIEDVSENKNIFSMSKVNIESIASLVDVVKVKKDWA